MSNKENGGPAFSGTYSARSDQGRGPVVEMHDKGMSLRDYFAAKAMLGFLSGPMNRVEFEGDGDVASLAYIMADAMLAERSK